MIEPKYKDVYDTWKADQSPANNAAILRAMESDIDKAIRANIGEPDPLIRSRARSLALKGLQTYDPAKARLRTHVFNHLKGLQRAAGKQRQILKVPERVLLDRRTLDAVTQELEDELGREPTDAEISNRSGFSGKRLARIRSFMQAANPGMLDTVSPDGFVAGINSTGRTAWLDMVYDDLGPTDKKIMEWSLGYNKKPTLSNQEIAKRLGRSPGAISQRKVAIQRLIDQEEGLSPF